MAVVSCACSCSCAAIASAISCRNTETSASTCPSLSSSLIAIIQNTSFTSEPRASFVLEPQMSLLREKIAANRELAAQLNALLSQIPLATPRDSQARLPSRDRKGAVLRKPLPLTPQFHDPRYRNLQEVLRRQAADPSLAHYPPLAMKIAARLKLRKLDLSRAVEEDLLPKGALWRLFRAHLQPGGPGL